MKSFRYIYIVALALIVNSFAAQGQVTVIAHASAEIVEIAGLSQAGSAPSQVIIEGENQKIEFGQFYIESPKNLQNELIITNSQATNSSGEYLNLEALTAQQRLLPTNGGQNALKNGVSVESNSQTMAEGKGFYSGSYNITLAYN